MKRLVVICSLAVVIAVSFLAGSLYQKRELAASKGSGGRTILYYIDPMNPGFKSDKPGIAPCGMKLEPVYADEAGTAGSAVDALSHPPGTVRIGPDRQQLIGVKVGKVEKKAGSHVIRVLGRVAVDDTRIFPLNAAVSGWIREISPMTVGNLVRKNDVLAVFSSPELIRSQQSYVTAVVTHEQFGGPTKTDLSEPSVLARPTIEQYRDALLKLGMGEAQIAEIGRTKQITQMIHIEAPGAGYIIARKAQTNLRFEKGEELYRIADINRVWILADIFESEAQLFRPGAKARITIPHQNRVVAARVTNALPQVDAASRTLKLRLEADNPGLVLKPDMFVDVELPVAYGPTIAVPVDAVIDSGLRKTVFVDLGDGYFEPRRVETGWRRGGLVEVTRGLMDREAIVISGTFLVDSESRMQAAAAGIYDTGVMDPVCGMYVDEKRTKAAGKVSEHRGTAYYFCSPECKRDFDADPRRYLDRAAGTPQAAAAGHAGHAGTPGRAQHSGLTGHEQHTAVPDHGPQKGGQAGRPESAAPGHAGHAAPAGLAGHPAGSPSGAMPGPGRPGGAMNGQQHSGMSGGPGHAELSEQELDALLSEHMKNADTGDRTQQEPPESPSPSAAHD